MEIKDLALPEIEIVYGNLHFSWNGMGPDIGIRAKVYRVRTHSSGDIKGELLLEARYPEGAKFPEYTHLHQAAFNFVSDSARKSLRKSLMEDFGIFDWRTILEQICVKVCDYMREGEPVMVVDSEETVIPVNHILKPILAEDMPCCIFGEGDKGKSQMSLWLAAMISSGWSSDVLDLRPCGEPLTCMILDYEGDYNEALRRLKRIQVGMGVKKQTLLWRRCELSLAEDMERIQEAIYKTKTRIVIIDSLGVACKGNLNDSEIAINFFSAMRKLRVTPIMLAHTSKDPKTKKKSIFGSVFFFNSSRMVWELTSAPDPRERGKIDIVMTNTKCNYDIKSRPLGFAMRISDSKMTLVSQQVTELAEEGSSHSNRLIAALRKGPQTTETLAEVLPDIERDRIRVVLNRLKEKGVTYKAGLKWGLQMIGGDEYSDYDTGENGEEG